MGQDSNGFVEITFRVSGVEELQRALVTFGAKVETMAPAWEQVGDDLRADFALNMATGGGLFGGKDGWAPLRPATVADRVRRGYSGEEPILWRDGDLGRSLADRGAPGNIFAVHETGVEVGTDDHTAPFHQHGTRRMVERPVVGITWDRRSLIVRRLNEYIIGIIRGEGL